MPYRFKHFDDTTAEFRRIGREQIDRALASVRDRDLAGPARIHEARKRCKKLRGLVRLVRKAVPDDAYQHVNTYFRDAARRVSRGRDAAAHIEAYDALCGHFDDQIDRRAFASIRTGLTRRLHEVEADGDAPLLDRLEADLDAGYAVLDAVEVERDGFAAVTGGLSKTYRRARERMADAADDGKPTDFHQWRKRAKYHRYHLKLLRSLWRGPIEAFGAEASRLGDLLGDAHDLAELDAHLHDRPDGLGNPDDVDAFLALARQRRRDLERRALPLGRRLFGPKPKAMRKLLATWHDAA